MPLPDEIIQSLPEEIRAEPGLQNFNDVGSLAKSFLETKKFVGSSIQLPAKDTKPEDLEKWRKEQLPKLLSSGVIEGPPESPEKYDIKIDQSKLPESVQLNQETVKEFRSIAHGLGLSNKQANTLIEYELKRLGAMMPSLVDEKEATSIVEKELGVKFVEAVDTARDAVHALSMEAIPGLKDWLEDTQVMLDDGRLTQLGNHPSMVKLLSEVGYMLQQSSEGGIGAVGVANPDAQKEIDDIMNNPNNPKNALWKKGDKATKEYVSNLWQQVTGGK